MSVAPDRYARPSQVVDINHLVDVIVIQNDLLLGDHRLFTAGIQRQESGTEEHLGLVVTMAVGLPVVAQLHRAPLLLENLDVGTQVSGARLRHGAGAGALGLDPVHPILQPGTVGIVNQRQLGLRVLGEGILVVPAGHPVGGVLVVAGQPLVPLAIIQQARFTEDELLNLFEIHAHADASSLLSAMNRARSLSTARSISSTQCWWWVT